MKKLLNHCAAGTALAALLLAGAPATAETRYSLQTGADLAQVCGNPTDAKALTAAERDRLALCGAYIQGFLGSLGNIDDFFPERLHEKRIKLTLE